MVKRELLFLVDALIYSKRFEPPFLLEAGVKPDFAIRVGRVKGLLERGWTGAEEVLGGNKVG